MEPSRLASSVVAPWGYKAGIVAPAQPTSSCMISHRSSTSFPMTENKEKNRETDRKKQEGVVGLMESRFSFPSIPWQSRVGQCQQSRKNTCKTF
jgi:hypothetical protein